NLSNMGVETAPAEPSLRDDEHEKKPEDGEPSPSASSAFIRLLSYTTAWDKTLEAVALASALGAGVGMAMVNLIFGKVVTTLLDFTLGRSTPSDFRSDVSSNAGRTIPSNTNRHPRLYFVYIGIGRLVLVYAYSALTTVVAYRIVKRLRCDFLQSALRQEVAWYDHGASGSITAQATSNGNTIQTAISEKLATVVQSFSTFVSAFALAFVTQWKLTLIISSVVPALIVIMGVVGTLDANIETNILSTTSQANAFAEGVLSTAKTVHAFGIRSRLVAKFDVYLQQVLRLGQQKKPIYGCYFSLEYFLIYCGYSLAFWRGIHMYAGGEVDSIGDDFTVLLSVVVGSSAITNLTPHILQFTRAGSAAAELFQTIDRTSDIDPLSTDGLMPTTTKGLIEFDNVTFEYPTRPGVTVLENFSLTIPVGKVTALVGASGSGKSTIIGLTERWYNPLSGSIRLDGQDINKLKLSWLRTTARLVQQEPVLFSGTRIAIARSIISEPRILLLDEATSALDPHAEGLVQQALDAASSGRTTITIAHKMSTIRDADNIVVMSKGKIIEQGNHEDLMRRDGAYSRLVQVQDLAVAQSSDASTTDSENEKAPANEYGHELLRRPTTQISRRDDENALTRDDYENHQQIGLFHVIWRIAKDTLYLKWWYALSLVACIAGAGTFPALSLLFAEISEAFRRTESAMISRGNFLALMFFVVALGNLIVYFALGWISNNIAQILNVVYRKQMFDRFLLQDLQFSDRPENTVGSLVIRLSTYSQSVQELMGMNISLIFISMGNVVVCAILAIAYSWKLGLVVVLGGMPPLMGSGLLKIRLEQQLETITGKRFASSASIASEAVTAIRTVSSLTMESSVLQKYSKELDFALEKCTKSVLIMMPMFALTQSIEYFVMALGFWYGCRLVSFGEITLKEFFVAFIGVFFAGQSAAQLFSFSTSITKAKHSANYILWLQQLEPAIAQTPENRDNRPSQGGESIEFENVSFAYPLRPEAMVMKSTSLSISKGQFIALVGASGCGKSTTIGLLERFYDPISGQVRIDNEPLKHLSPIKYRECVSLVQQEPVLYQGSVRENIKLGTPNETVSDTKIEEACRSANAWDFITSLPEGLNTACGLNGSQFSGGQKQRIAIARALVRDPKILLLDEATSALDTESEKIVQQALRKAAQDGERITIAVAHRLSTVRDADAIHVFHGGRVVESGTHSQLLAKGEMYAAMCRSQNVA
ncbi:Sophorolipid transporter, partial [Pseudocercospora fuligena]